MSKSFQDALNDLCEKHADDETVVSALREKADTLEGDNGTDDGKKAA